MVLSWRLFKKVLSHVTSPDLYLARIDCLYEINKLARATCVRALWMTTFKKKKEKLGTNLTDCDWLLRSTKTTPQLAVCSEISQASNSHV